MFRKDGWLAVCGMLVTGAAVFAQGPGPTSPGVPSIYGNPGAYGYPGYPTPGYDPLRPPQPALPPGNPPGYLPSVPGMAPIPNGFAPPSGPFFTPAPGGPVVNPGPTGPIRSLPAYDGNGPQEGA